MATKIKRCLYIGLGGTGMKSLLHTKKMFIDTYGEVPPMIGFLGIDTDGGEYTKTLESALGEKVSIEPNEQLYIKVEDAKPIYNRQRSSFTWVPDQNVYALSSMTLGAGQVRTNGRFAFTVNKSRVEQTIKNKLNEIQNAKIINNKNYELLSSGAPEIHMVFSICGGTGSGTFLNMAYLLRDVAPDSKINGYAVLPEVFKAMTSTGMAKVTPNAYGALVDLDYLMHRSLNDTPIMLEYLNGDAYEISERPFNSVVFIDNKNANGDTYTDVSQLTEMISLALITASGELSVAGAAVGDNLEKNIAEGSMNIENKIAWAGGMGACEIVYRGDALAKIYQLKAAQHIIENLFNSCQDANMIANSWIDSSAVHIRENNGQDHVTDFISPKEPSVQLMISDAKNPVPEVNINLEANKLDDKEVTERVDELLTRTRTELRKLIVKHINGECGVTLAQKIVENIKIEMGLCLEEMRAEKVALAKDLPQLKAVLETAIADLKEYANRFLKTQSNVDQRATVVAMAVANINRLVRDVKRHDAAITFYQSFIINLNETEEKLNKVASILRAVENSLTQRIAQMQKSVGDDDAIFQINLAVDDARKVTIKSGDILISEFIGSLEGDHKLYGLEEFTAKEVEKIILNYTATLPGAKMYNSKNVEDVFAQMLAQDEENGTDELRRLLTRAVSKSMPLFRHDPDGYSRDEEPSDIFYIGVCNAKDSILIKDDLFKSTIAGMPNVQFASTGMKDKVIIYRQVGVVPVFTIDGIKNFEKDYNTSKACNFHFDANILLRMERDNFSIYPEDVPDDVFSLWVKGFIYGLIKNENKSYYMQCSLGDDLDDNWYKLAEWRDEAYAEFARHEGVVVKEFNAHINAEIERVGAEATRRLLDEAKADYYEGYSQIKIQRATLKQKGYEKVAELMRAELALVKKL